MSLVSRSYHPSTNLIDSFIQSFEQERLRKNADELIRVATTYFNDPLLPDGTPVFNQTPVSYAPTAPSPASAIQEIFQSKSFQGVCLGELHTHWSPKHVIIELLPSINHLVKTIFVENLKNDDIQDCLDEWLQNNDIDMPDEIRSALGDLDYKYKLPPPFSYTRLVEEAKKAKIRVVAIDTSASFIAGVHPHQPLKTEERIIAMNYTAKKIIDMELEKHPGGFIILTGINHSSKLVQCDIPGLSELIKCPCFIINDTTHSRKEPGTHHNPLPKQFGLRNEPNTVHSVMIVQKPLL